MDLVDLIQFINDRHHRAFALVGACRGGLQGGAHELIDLHTSQHLILKQAFAPYTPPVIDRLRAADYPTPAWLFAGEAPDGTRYVVQSCAPGVPMCTLTTPYLDQILAINTLQADLNPHPDGGQWSQYARNVVFANEGGWTDLIHAYTPETATLLAALHATALLAFLGIGMSTNFNRAHTSHLSTNDVVMLMLERN